MWQMDVDEQIDQGAILSNLQTSTEENGPRYVCQIELHRKEPHTTNHPYNPLLVTQADGSVYWAAIKVAALRSS